jgi:hypothetical protein
MKTNKRLFNMLMCAVLLLSTLSCQDFLTEDPKGQLASQDFFTSRKDLDLALNALYQEAARMHQSNNNGCFTVVAGDDISTHPASNKQPLREFDQFSVSDNNSWMASAWERRWAAVKVANFVINNAANTPEVSADEIRSAIAQAHFWRAYAYFNLVQTWGPVPVMLEEEIDYNAPLVPIETIYDMIVEDMKIAEAGVPVHYTDEPYGRNGMNLAVSQGAVKATLSYIYLAMAGWPLNKGAEYYQLAANKAKEVIDGAESGTYYYRLLDEYWKVYSWEYNNQNPEVILGTYFNQNALENWSTITDLLQDMKQAGWGDTNGEIKFWKDFPDGPRKEATYTPKVLLSDGELHDWWWDTDPPSRAVVAPCFMKTAEGAIRYTEFDYTDPRTIGMTGDKMHQLIRLSEVYCWYAEAIGRLGQTNAKAVEVLNKVRNRADGAETNLYSASMTPDQLAEAAYNEHGWEIAGYYWTQVAPRYRDMFRMNRVKEHFEYRKLNQGIEVAPGIFRSEAVPVEGTWSDSKMYAPYPYGDVVLNPSLKR